MCTRATLFRHRFATFRLFALLPLLALAVGAPTACRDSGDTGSDGGAAPVPSEEVDAALLPEDGSTSDAATSDARPPFDGAVECSDERLRVVAGNLSGAGGTYDDGRGTRIFKGLRPDVALVQELRVGDNSTAAQRAWVDAAFGAGYAFVRGSLFGAVDIPNAVVSRFPIVESGEWTDPLVSNRTFVWARIDVPGAADLWAVSVHLLTTNATERGNEAAALVTFMKGVPAGSLLLVGGDLNTNSRAEQAVTNLGAVFVTEGPYPIDQAGNANTNTPRSRPYDWVLAGGALEACKTPVTIGADSYVGGLVFDSRVYAPLSDVAPVELADSDSPLQHMAVVRDFFVPR